MGALIALVRNGGPVSVLAMAASVARTPAHAEVSEPADPSSALMGRAAGSEPADSSSAPTAAVPIESAPVCTVGSEPADLSSTSRRRLRHSTRAHSAISASRFR